MSEATRPFVPIWLGRRRYAPVHELQRRLVARRLASEVGDLLLLLEHEAVVTLGRGAPAGDVRQPPAELARRGVDVVETGRGGKGTYHGPGQLVGYPLLDLKPDRCDVRRYVRGLASLMEGLAADFGLEAGFLPDARLGTWVDRASPGAWPGEGALVDPAKLGAIGVRLSRWVTMHGFAFNGSTDLDEFRSLVTPCGITDRDITSVADLLGSSPAVRDLALRAVNHASAVWGAPRGPLVDLSNVDDEAIETALIEASSAFSSAPIPWRSGADGGAREGDFGGGANPASPAGGARSEPSREAVRHHAGSEKDALPTVRLSP